MGNAKMPHAGHDEHLCYLANLGFMAESPDEYRMLVKDVHYFCRQCGRAAASANNLCKSEKITFSKPGNAKKRKTYRRNIEM